MVLPLHSTSSSVFQHSKLSCHRAHTVTDTSKQAGSQARTQTHPLSTAPFALHSRARKSQIQCCPVDLAAAADFCHYSSGVSWGCLSETARALCAAVECVDCVKILRMHVYVRVCVCACWWGLWRCEPAALKSNCNFLSSVVCMSSNCNSNNVNIISTINVK